MIVINISYIIFNYSVNSLMLSFLFEQKYQFDSLLDQFLNGEKHIQLQSQLHNIMSALRGEDTNIKSQIAFAKLKKVITAFQIQTNQFTVIKQLIVLDKLVQDNLFCNEIQALNFFTIDSHNKTQSNQNIGRILRLFWKIIKDKSSIMNQNDHILKEKRSQRENYLKKLKPGSIFNQISSIEPFFTNIFELVYCLQQPSFRQERELVEWKKRGAIEYIVVHLLYKLLYLYNCQNSINKLLISKLQTMTENEIVKFKKYMIKFKENCQKIIIFIQQNHNTQGFQILTLEQIKNELNQKLIKLIDEYLQNLEAKMNEPILQKLPINLGKLKVQNNPLNLIGKNIVPRLHLKNQQSMTSSKSIRRRQQNQLNPFLNWQNSYSHEFPQKQIMSVDLILQIKLEQTLMNQEEQQIEYQRDNNVYFSSKNNSDNRSTFTSSNYSINFFKVKEYAINVLEKKEFHNIYSKLPAKWNQI